jgi:nickel-dependent lactate racemase
VHLSRPRPGRATANNAYPGGPQVAQQLYEFLYGKTAISVPLPTEKILYDIKGGHLSAIADIPAAVRAALAAPIGTPPLREIIAPGDKVAITVSDITRAWVQFDAFLPVLLDELNNCGVPDENITIVIALGAHRRNTGEELALLCGETVCHRVKMVQHDAHDKENLVYAGTTSRGVATYINKTIMSADKVILTGGITFHLMAGFGGGRKGIMPGVSGYDTIQGNHRFCLSAEIGNGLNPNCQSGRTVGNEMHEDMTEMAAMVNPAFLLHAVLTPEGRIGAFVAGHWNQAWQEGCRIVEQTYGVPVAARADLVVASAGGFPKDINLYQAIKALDNAYMAVKPGGAVICFLECEDINEPPEYMEWMKYKDPLEFELAVRKKFTVPGYSAFRLQHMTKQAAFFAVTRPENFAIMREAGLTPVAGFDEAYSLACRHLGRDDYTITVMTQAANTVPLLVPGADAPR